MQYLFIYKKPLQLFCSITSALFIQARIKTPIWKEAGEGWDVPFTGFTGTLRHTQLSTLGRSAPSG